MVCVHERALNAFHDIRSTVASFDCKIQCMPLMCPECATACVPLQNPTDASRAAWGIIYKEHQPQTSKPCIYKTHAAFHLVFAGCSSGFVMRSHRLSYAMIWCAFLSCFAQQEVYGTHHIHIHVTFVDVNPADSDRCFASDAPAFLYVHLLVRRTLPCSGNSQYHSSSLGS